MKERKSPISLVPFAEELGFLIWKDSFQTLKIDELIKPIVSELADAQSKVAWSEKNESSKLSEKEEEGFIVIKGLYEAHLPVSNLKRSIEFYQGLGLEFDHQVEDNLAFLWIERDRSWLGLWNTDKVEIEYHPSIRHIAFEVSMDGLKQSVEWLKDRVHEPRKAFGFEPTEPFVMPNRDFAHAKIHFDDPDGNSLEFICKIANPNKIKERMYLSEWEQLHAE